MPTQYVISRETFLPLPIDEVFEFFSKAENLEAITPDSLKFKIITPLPIEMKEGTKIDYRLSLNGIPMIWKTDIEVWDPPMRFVDNQLKGPYRRWWHEHKFEPVEGGTLMYDHVEYILPFGPLGDLVHALWVKRQVESIFTHRGEAIKKHLQI